MRRCRPSRRRRCQRLRRDFDSFDDYCDHLLVIDRALPAGPRRVVGTYRLLRRAMAEKRGQFYSVDEYDIRQILAFPGEILELGRSCIEPAYRQRSIMQLMWRGIADYVMYHEIGLMFGCASLAGVDPAAHALALSYLLSSSSGAGQSQAARACPRAMSP